MSLQPRGLALGSITHIPVAQVALNDVPWCPIFVIICMELASYLNSGVLDSDVASGVLENLWNSDAGILQTDLFF